jgi:hypothetical protein
MTKPDPAMAAEAWLRASADDKTTLASKLLPEKIEAVARRMAEKIPDGTAEQWSAWLTNFAEQFGEYNLRTTNRGDIAKGLTASGMLGLANGEDHRHLPKRKI